MSAGCELFISLLGLLLGIATSICGDILVVYTSLRGYCIHIGVGFEVAYLFRVGKFEGLGRGISNGDVPTLFLCRKSIDLLTNAFGNKQPKRVKRL